MGNTRQSCYEIPSERLSMLLWLRATYPTGWRAIWQRVVLGWRA